MLAFSLMLQIRKSSRLKIKIPCLDITFIHGVHLNISLKQSITAISNGSLFVLIMRVKIIIICIT